MDFDTEQYIRKSPILTCNCGHEKCNGLYIKVKPDQLTCWWTYLEQKKWVYGIIYRLNIIKITMENYTKEQMDDITSREEKALKALEELHFTPAAIVYKINVGGDVFADKLQPYLKDTKYSKNEDGTYSEKVEKSEK